MKILLYTLYLSMFLSNPYAGQIVQPAGGGSGSGSVGTVGQIQMVGATAGSFAASSLTDNGTAVSTPEPISPLALVVSGLVGGAPNTGELDFCTGPCGASGSTTGAQIVSKGGANAGDFSILGITGAGSGLIDYIDCNHTSGVCTISNVIAAGINASVQMSTPILQVAGATCAGGIVICANSSGNFTVNTSGTINTAGSINGASYAVGGVAGKLVVRGTGNYTTATSDAITVTGATASSVCTFSATNALAAVATVIPFISAVAANSVTISHVATTASGGTVNVICTIN